MSAPSAKSDSTTLSASLDRKEFRQANAAAMTAGAEIARTFAKASRRQRLRLANTFLRQLLPRRKGGRRNTAVITAAHADWKAGMRGVALYERHIPGFRKMSYWEKKAKIDTLNGSISKRENRRKSKSCPTDKSKSCPPENLAPSLSAFNPT